MKVEWILKVEPVSKSNGFQRFRHPRRRFFMHFCAFWQFSKSNVRCNVNSMFAKLVFSEICTQKAHFARLWAVLGSIRRAGRCCGQDAPFCIPLPKSNGFESRTKVERLEKSNDFARKNLRQSRIGFELCTFVACFRYIPRDFDHFSWIFVSDGGFGGGIIIRVEGSFLTMTASRSRYPLLYFPLFGFIPLCFPAFWGLLPHLTGISALILGFATVFKRIARYLAL